MSSIRPLVTITILTVIGAFLLMKINETEPPLPEGAEVWNEDIQIEANFGPSDTSSTFGVPTAGGPTSTAPAYQPAAATSTAPAFQPSSAAPAWTDNASMNTAANPSPTVADTAPAFVPNESNPSSDPMAELPELPPLPAMASAGESAPTFDAAIDSSSKEQTSKITQAETAPSQADNLDTTPTPSAPPTESTPATQASLFSATRTAVQAALDRGELSHALLLLSDWYGDPSLSPSESQEIQTLLSQLAGSVIYSTENRLEPPYMVRAGERLEDIAAEYDVPWQLLAKINGLASPDQLQPGQQLKVLRGPFTATIDLSRRRMTLMLDRRYAGQFTIEVDPGVTIEEGTWTVNQKLITPGDVGFAPSGPTAATDDRSLMLTNPNGDVSQVTIIRSASSSGLAASTPTSRVVRLKSRDVEDVFDILSLGSRVVIRR